MTRRTIQATIIAFDADACTVTFRYKQMRDIVTLRGVDAFGRFADIYFDPEEATEPEWRDDGAARRAIDARIRDRKVFLNDLKSASKTYECALVAGEISGLEWCREKFTNAPKEPELHDKDHPCLDSPCMKCGNPQPKLKAWRQDWEESERGWGVRPDGYTLHLTKEGLNRYVAGYYAENNNAAETPDEYTRTCGEPREVEITREQYAALMKKAADAIGYHKMGVWFH